MADPKKIIYWLISLISVIGVYGLYTFVVKAPTIKPMSVQNDTDELPLPDFPKNTSKVADVGIGSVARTEFVTRDEVTYKVKRIFGFAEMLNPKGKTERWKLKKPYMKFFGDEFYCQINSDKGNVKVETIMGEPNPTQGTLFGHVVIKFESQKNGKTTQSFVYLDTLDYDSDRSELATDGPVEFVSEDITMKGRGMLLLYNTALSRIEYFEIRDMEYLHVYNVEVLQDSPSEQVVTQKEIVTSQTVATSGAVVDPVVSAPVVKAVAGETVSDEGASEEEKNYYRCSFRKNVMINHSGRLIATGADNVNIFNILPPAKGNKQESAATPVAAVESKPSDTSATGAPAAVSAPNAPAVAGVTPDIAPEVIVTCQGGFVVTPMAQAADEASRDNSPSVLNLQKKAASTKIKRRLRTSEVTSESPQASKEQKPARFRSQIIDYYINRNTMVGYGSVEFIFYPAPDPNAVENAPASPIVITADDKVRYVADENIATFSGNVVCRRTDINPEFIQDSNCIGDKLDITLYKKDADADGLSLKHVTVSGENTELNSRRLVGDKVINWIQLVRSQIDYDAIEEVVRAGPGGEIAINNSKAPPAAETGKKSLGLSGPCYAFIGGFDLLEWSLKNNTIYALGEKDNGVEIGYIPVVDGQLGQAIHATARKINGIFTSTDTKRTELVTLTASEGVHYYEDGGHQFYGDRLFYTAAETLMIVTGSDDKPCFVDGAQTDRIDYNLATGELKTALSPRPSTISSPRRRRP